MTIAKNKVYITYSSSKTAAANSNEELFEALVTRQSGIAVDSNYFKGFSPAIGRFKDEYSLESLVLEGCQNALYNSTLDNFEDTLLIACSSVGGMQITENSYFSTGNYKQVNPKLHNIGSIDHILDQYNFKESIGFSTACTSSGNAIGYAHEVLSKGIYKNVLIVAVDTISKTTVGGFLSLGVLSSEPCKPFDVNRDGMNVAEGFAVLLLQNEKSDNCVEVCGVGYSSDAYHITQPHPEGEGAQKAMQNALNIAKIDANQIDYINAHGTGTLANDSSEAKAIAAIFSKETLVTSTKSITGHTLGAAGAIEAVISSMVIQKGIIPTSTNLENIENNDVGFARENIQKEVKYVLSNSFAFGGNNCSIILGKVNEA